MALQQILVDAAPAQPWRNGGGSTRALFTWPGAASPWQLRISVADITRDGPFSAYTGVERWFAVLQGAGVQLSLPAGLQRLNLHSPPLQFPGEAAPGCQLVGGATRDLNLMLQRGAGQAELLDASAGQPWVHAAPLRGLFTTAALTLQVDQDAPLAVATWTLVLASHAAQQRWQIGLGPAPSAATGRCLWLAFTPANRP